MEAVSILVVEDEVIIADHLCATLEELGYDVMEPALSYSQAIDRLAEKVPDIAILDIQLSGRKTGIDLAEVIGKEYQFPFIFLTSNSDRITLEAAKSVRPSAFLVKPYSKEELYTSIEVALFNYAEQSQSAINQENLVVRDSLFLKQNKTFKRVKFEDILFIESSHVYLEVFLAGGEKLTVRSTFKDFMTKVTGNFEKVHRSFVVNWDHVQGINQTVLVMTGEYHVPVSRAYKERVMDRILKT